ncbi:hypothetical protein D3C71_1930800 [compost metagenome]
MRRAHHGQIGVREDHRQAIGGHYRATHAGRVAHAGIGILAAGGALVDVFHIGTVHLAHKHRLAGR